MTGAVVHIDDDGFEKLVLRSDMPVLLDFWAEWCEPCKAIAPILDELAASYKDRLVVAKMNTDQNQNTPAKYAVRGIPTLLLFKNGSVAADRVGTGTKSQLEAFIDSHL